LQGSHEPRSQLLFLEGTFLDDEKKRERQACYWLASGFLDLYIDDDEFQMAAGLASKRARETGLENGVEWLDRNFCILDGHP
jgi:hypothetical protein